MNNKKSIGALFVHKKTKERSPDMTGQVALQRETIEQIAKGLVDPTREEIVCNIAAWSNVDKTGKQSLTVEISPRFGIDGLPMPRNLGFIFDRKEEDR
jgi:hypothetical protein